MTGGTGHFNFVSRLQLYAADRIDLSEKMALLWG